MTTQDVDGENAALSALQRRLAVVDARPDEDWLVLVENVPVWPKGYASVIPPSRTSRESSFSYSASRGTADLLEAIVVREAKASGARLMRTSNVVATNGGMNAIGVLLRDCFAEGFRKAVEGTPTFVGVRNAIIAAGISPETVPLTATEDDWPVLEAVCTEPTVVYVNLPHNPTGAIPTTGYLDMLGRFAATHDVFVLYDAVYDSFVFDGEGCAAPVDLAVSVPNFAVVNSMSKNYGRPGDRIGWIIGHEDLTARLVPRLEWELVCVNGSTQSAAAQVIAAGNDALVGAVQSGREAFRRAARGHDVLDVPLPGGGTQLWLDLGVADIESFADFALAKHHVVLTTSSNYSPAYDGWIRFPTGVPPERVAQGVAALDRILADWPAGGRRLPRTTGRSVDPA